MFLRPRFNWSRQTREGGSREKEKGSQAMSERRALDRQEKRCRHQTGIHDKGRLGGWGGRGKKGQQTFCNDFFFARTCTRPTNLLGGGGDGGPSRPFALAATTTTIQRHADSKEKKHSSPSTDIMSQRSSRVASLPREFSGSTYKHCQIALLNFFLLL